jgi:hypothetical protein
MKTFVEISMLTWETAAAGTDGGAPIEGSAERFAPGSDAFVPANMDCSVRSDVDWIREHDGFAASIVSLGVPHA